MAIQYLKLAHIKGKTVLVRGSVDVPVDESTGKVSDDFRLRSFLPTIEFLIANGNKVIICGKRGRPKGKVVESLSLKPVAERLADLLGAKFITTDDRIPDYNIRHVIFYSGNFQEDKNAATIKKSGAQNIIVLENLEFYPAEQGHDDAFAQKLANLADAYVNDDFAKCHHPVASNIEITKYLPSYAGLLLEKEIKSLVLVLKNAKHPFVIMTGGIKLSEKVGALQNLGKHADKILVSGGVANLLFLAKGFEIGLSRLEEGEVKTAWEIEKNFKNKIVLPRDLVVANEALDKNSIRVCVPYEVRKDEKILDIGPQSILMFSRELKLAKTIVWSGPPGLFEKKPFDTATKALGRLIGGLGKRKAFVVAGGGDTVDAIRQAHQIDHIDHVSTGGGAMLEFLAGNKLPGLEALGKTV